MALSGEFGVCVTDWWGIAIDKDDLGCYLCLSELFLSRELADTRTGRGPWLWIFLVQRVPGAVSRISYGDLIAVPPLGNQSPRTYKSVSYFMPFIHFGPAPPRCRVLKDFRWHEKWKADSPYGDCKFVLLFFSGKNKCGVNQLWISNMHHRGYVHQQNINHFCFTTWVNQQRELMMDMSFKDMPLCFAQIH